MCVGSVGPSEAGFPKPRNRVIAATCQCQVMKPDHRTADATLTNDRRHVFHSWSAQAQISPMAMAGSGGWWEWNCAG